MKIPFKMTCQQCGVEEYVDLHLSDDSPEWPCTSCNHQNSGFFDNNFTIGWKILHKSNYEVNVHKDYAMSVVFSAMAFECEISRLYQKWTDIDAFSAGIQLSDQALDDQLRILGNAQEKIEQTCRLVVSEGLDEFVRASKEFSDLTQRFPSLRIGSLAKDFQEQLFWPRNRILHKGEAKVTESDAQRSLTIAWQGLQILEAMDKERRGRPCRTLNGLGV